MFSFFKKKSPPAGGTPAPRDAPASSEGDAGADRPKGARHWLNADVGELFFGKKSPDEAGRSRTPDASTPVDPAATRIEPDPVAVPASAPVAVPLATPLPAEQAEPDRSDWLAKLRSGLRRTGAGIADAFVAATIDDAMYENLETALLQADTGIAATQYLLDDLERRVTRAHIREPAAMRRLLADCIADLLAPLERPLRIGEHSPTVMMVVGVNGAGKTTSVGKLARHLIDSDQKVMLAAADTFRAAAREQLLAWAERADTAPNGAAGTGTARPAASRIEIVSQEGGDPAGVTFDAVVAGKARGCDVVIADTAGRLATQAHLMEELKKIHRTIGKAQAGAPHEVLLVIDGNSGQNALAQVQAFDAALHLTGLIITKLDGTAKGGVLAAIALWSRSRAEPLPVYFIGVGEQLADLQTFRAREFADALVS